MGPIKELMEERLRDQLAPSILEILDESPQHGSTKPSHFRILIVSDAFEGLSAVKRHQRVYEVLGDIMNVIHAFSQQTYTVSEWENSGIRLDSPPCRHSKK
ncbi:MAG: BolA family transcriptional regulator [Bdellovibrionales bacterium]|nr:BolA family transcriptional regulator [Bdellovibrionales bacterium]